MTSASRNKAKKKTYFKVTFTYEDEVYQVCARHVETSEWMGMIEVSEFIFPEGGLVYNPGEERLRKEFEGIQRTWVPFHAVLRIDEISDNRTGEVKIVPLRGGGQTGREVALHAPKPRSES